MRKKPLVVTSAISIDPPVRAKVLRAAREEPVSVTAWFAESVRHALTLRGCRKEVACWEQVNGVFTDAEFAAARVQGMHRLTKMHGCLLYNTATSWLLTNAKLACERYDLFKGLNIFETTGPEVLPTNETAFVEDIHVAFGIDDEARDCETAGHLSARCQP
jgi:hypothetical protein